MANVAMSGDDTVLINNRSFTSFADGDFAKLSFPNKIANVRIGKNGNATYGLNQAGKMAEFELRLIRDSADDQFLNALLLQQQNNFSAFPLMFGTFVKLIGDGSGNVGNDTYIVSGGVFVEQVMAKSNAEGDTEQSVAVYKINFSNSPRALT